MTPISRTWKVHKATGISARRTGYTLMPDFASTAHMIQGATLDAVFCEMQDASGKSRDAQILAYVGASRVRLLSRIYILQPFSPTLFTQGPPKGPDVLLRKLEGSLTPIDALREWETPEDTPQTPIYSNRNFCVCHAICTKKMSTCTDCQYLVAPLLKMPSQCCIQKGSGAGACAAVTCSPNTLATYVALPEPVRTITQSTYNSSYIEVVF